MKLSQFTNVRPILLILLLVTVLLSGSVAVAMLAPTLSNTVTATGVVLPPTGQEISLIHDDAWGGSVTFTYGNEEHNDFAGGDTATVYLKSLNHLNHPLTVTSIIMVEKLSGTNAPLNPGQITFTYNGNVGYSGVKTGSGIQYTVTQMYEPGETVCDIGMTFNNAHWRPNPGHGNGNGNGNDNGNETSNENGNSGHSPERSSEFMVTLVSTAVVAWPSLNYP